MCDVDFGKVEQMNMHVMNSRVGLLFDSCSTIDGWGTHA